MARSLLLYCYKNVIRSLYVHQSKEGTISIAQSLGVLGTITASGIGMGCMKQWIYIDPSLLLKWSWFRSCKDSPDTIGTNSNGTQHTTETDSSLRGTTTSNVDSYETNHKIIPTTNSTSTGSSHLFQLSQTFLRVLFVPSFCEEIIWRGIFIPPPVVPSSIFYIVVVNICYTLSHVVHAQVLSLFRHPSIRHIIHDDKSNSQDNNRESNTESTSIEKTIKVFTDPSFLFMTFILGNVCSYSYIKAGYALYAPVLIHSISVSIWLSFLGGNQALGRSC